MRAHSLLMWALHYLTPERDVLLQRVLVVEDPRPSPANVAARLASALSLPPPPGVGAAYGERSRRARRPVWSPLLPAQRWPGEWRGWGLA